MDKKNTLLLTVIAIATLLVAVVGATFAYFSAQIGQGKSAQMTVTTSNEDTLTYGSFKPLYIIATQTNFANTAEHAEEQVGSQKGVATGVVEYRKGGGETSKDYCYTAKLNVSTNTFKYPTFAGFNFNSDPDAPTMDSEHAPELLLTLTKVQKTKDDPSGASHTIKYTQTLPNNDAIKYISSMKKQRKVCLQEGQDGSISSCEDTVSLTGYDITELTQTIDIPNVDGGSASDLKHKLTAKEQNDTVTDEWSAELVFVNYDWDQQYNVGKVFMGSLEFNNVDCAGD